MKLEINTPSYNYYAHSITTGLVAVERTESKAIGKAFKKYKRAEKIPDDLIVKGYPFVLDEEYQSLKINFSEEFSYKIKDLEKAEIN